MATAGFLAAQPQAAQAAGGRAVSGPIRAGLVPGDHGQPVRVLQGDLWELGYNPGPVDGVFGALTTAALKRFQRDHGLSPTGTLNAATFDAILRAGGWGPYAASGPERSARTRAPQSQASVPGGRTLHMVATAYGPNWIDNYPYGPVDYFGQPLRPGVVAVDPDVIPLGTRLWVTGYRSPYLPKGGFAAVARDTGGAIQGNRIDIFIDAPRSEVLKFGIQDVTVTILGN